MSYYEKICEHPSPCPFLYRDCPDCPYYRIHDLRKSGGDYIPKTTQQTFKSTDYGDMTLAKLGPEGVEFLLKEMGKEKGKFGDFVALMGILNDEPFEIRAGGRAAKLLIAEEKNLIGKVISIIPHGDGMQRWYEFSVVE